MAPEIIIYLVGIPLVYLVLVVYDKRRLPVSLYGKIEPLPYMIAALLWPAVGAFILGWKVINTLAQSILWLEDRWEARDDV